MRKWRNKPVGRCYCRKRCSSQLIAREECRKRIEKWSFIKNFTWEIVIVQRSRKTDIRNGERKVELCEVKNILKSIDRLENRTYFGINWV